MYRFIDWDHLQTKLNHSELKPPSVVEGEIWWAYIGFNIGQEINGKGALLTRPVLILKKFSNKFFMAIPLTTSPHQGSWYYPFLLGSRKNFACLHQIRSLDYRRLSTRIGRIPDEALINITTQAQNLLFR